MYEQYVGNHIELLGPEGDLAWEGLIWTLDLDYAGGRLSRGLTGLANRVAVQYSFIPVGGQELGSRLTTPWANDTLDPTSQSQYGIVEYAVRTGGMQTATATALRNAYLADNALPGMSKQFAVPMGRAVRLRLTAMGYWATAKYMIYQNEGVGQDTIDNIIRNIVSGAYSPGTRGAPLGAYGARYLQFVDLDPEQIQASTDAISVYHFDDWDVQTYLLHLIEMGSAAGDFFFIGVYDDRKLHVFPRYPPGMERFSEIPPNRRWCTSLGSPVVQDSYGAEWPKYKVRAGTFLTVRDLVPSAALTQTPEDELRTIYVGETEYNVERDTLTVKPVRSESAADALLARTGLKR